VDHVLPDIDFGRDALLQLEAQLAALIAAGERVVPVRYLGGTAWLILRHEDVGRAFRDPRQFPAAAANLRYSLPVQGRTLLCMEGEEHRIHRALVADAFQPRAVQALLGAVLRPLAHELIDGFGARRELDLVAAYCHRYPLRVIARLLGIPAADEEQLFAWVRGLFDYPFNPQAALTARDEVNAFLLPLIHARRSAPRADLISRLASAQVEAHSLSDEDILSFVKLLFPAGADTTYLTMGSMMNAVLGDEALRGRLLREPARIADAVAESVRLYGAVGLLPRYTETGARVGGVDIPPDSWVLFGVRSAGRDAAQYVDPERFELTRHAQRLVSFGGMPHFCLGVHLAKAELATSLELLLARLPGLRLAQGPMPQSSAVLRGVRRLPVAFDALLPAR
jgi:cytochrome P450